MTILQSDNGLILRPWQDSDVESITKYANNPKISMNLRDRFPYPYTREDARDWIKFVKGHDLVTHFAIELNSEAIGGIGLTIGDDIFRLTAEIGYWLGEPHWGKGIGTEAIKLVTSYGFDTLGLVRVFAGVFENNAVSARVLEKAGYRLEAVQRKSIVKNGKILDQLLYVAIKN